MQRLMKLATILLSGTIYCALFSASANAAEPTSAPEITSFKDVAWAIKGLSDQLSLVLWVVSGAAAAAVAVAGFCAAQIIELRQFMGKTEALLEDVRATLILVQRSLRDRGGATL